MLLKYEKCEYNRFDSDRILTCNEDMLLYKWIENKLGRKCVLMLIDLEHFVVSHLSVVARLHLKLGTLAKDK